MSSLQNSHGQEACFCHRVEFMSIYPHDLIEFLVTIGKKARKMVQVWLINITTCNTMIRSLIHQYLIQRYHQKETKMLNLSSVQLQREHLVFHLASIIEPRAICGVKLIFIKMSKGFAGTRMNYL